MKPGHKLLEFSFDEGGEEATVREHHCNGPQPDWVHCVNADYAGVFAYEEVRILWVGYYDLIRPIACEESGFNFSQRIRRESSPPVVVRKLWTC